MGLCQLCHPSFRANCAKTHVACQMPLTARASAMMQGSAVLVLLSAGSICASVGVWCKSRPHFFHATHCALKSNCHDTVFTSVAKAVKSPQHSGRRVWGIQGSGIGAFRAQYLGHCLHCPRLSWSLPQIIFCQKDTHFKHIEPTLVCCSESQHLSGLCLGASSSGPDVAECTLQPLCITCRDSCTVTHTMS